MSSKAIPPPDDRHGIKWDKSLRVRKRKFLSEYLPFTAFARDIRTRTTHFRQNDSTAVSRW